MRLTYLLLLLLVGANTDDDLFQNYSSLINKAELQICQSNYHQALILYKEAFKLPFGKFDSDYRNAFASALKINNEKEALELWNEIRKKPSLCKAILLDKNLYPLLPPSLRDTSNACGSDAAYSQAERSFNNVLDSLLIVDQQIRHFCGGYKPGCLDTIKYVDGKNFQRLEKLIKEYRTGKKLTHLSSIYMLDLYVLCVHARMWGFAGLDQELKQLVLSGVIKPIQYARLLDYRSGFKNVNDMTLTLRQNMRLTLIPAMILLLYGSTSFLPAKKQAYFEANKKQIIAGADQTEKYLPYLKGKRVAILANPTSIIGKKHLVDSLQALGINIVKVFGPEHGFRGNASAGARVKDEIDSATGIPIISLYGPKNKPSREDLADVDIMVYDLQDVGVRFYTNINALARLMEACAESDKELMILDRPNPNGYLIDGPVLDMKYKSGIGMFPIPMSHGLTVAEFAQMANGEGWLKDKEKCKLRIIRVANYDHNMAYTLPVKPSPNLNTQQAVMLYPSTCMFEATYLNHGRGTYFPFTVLGSPELKGKYAFSFTPTSIKGMAETPLFMDQVCYGLDLRNYDINLLRKSKQINLHWIMELYKAHPHKEKFFDSKLSREMNRIEIQIGSGLFRQQIIDGKSEKEIRASWEPGLSEYKKMRKKYLLYP